MISGNTAMNVLFIGNCLAALTHYHTLWGQFPEKVDSLHLDNTVTETFRVAVCG